MLVCPGRERLERFLDGDLSAAASERLAAHVEICVDCQVVLDRLTRERPGPPRTVSVGEENAAAEPAPESLERLHWILPR